SLSRRKWLCASPMPMPGPPTGAIATQASHGRGCNRGGGRICRSRSMTNTKIALVTGAGSGIGRAVAMALLRDGYRVTLVGRRPEPLEGAIAEASVDPDRALAVSADITDPVSVAELFRR